MSTMTKKKTLLVSFEEFAGGEPIVLGTSPEASESTENAEEIASRSASPIGSKLEKHACSSNEIKLKQDLILLFYFDNMPAKFNRVLGEEVDADIAIQCLNHMIELHMSETEGDDFLALMDRIVTKSTGKFFPMPIRSKTLTRAFLGKTDVFFPLAISKISILPQIFGTGEKADLLPLSKPFIKLEDALSNVLLKINPSELTKDFIPEFEEVNGVWQRVYNGFGSGDYPIEILDQLKRKFVGIAFILCLSWSQECTSKL